MYGIRWTLGRHRRSRLLPALEEGGKRDPHCSSGSARPAQPWEAQGGGWTARPGRYLPAPQSAQAVLAIRCSQALPAAEKSTSEWTPLSSPEGPCFIPTMPLPLPLIPQS